MIKERDIHAKRLQKLEKIEKNHFINAKCRNNVHERALNRTKDFYNVKSDSSASVLAGRIRDVRSDLDRIGQTSGSCAYKIRPGHDDLKMLRDRVKPIHLSNNPTTLQPSKMTPKACKYQPSNTALTIFPKNPIPIRKGSVYKGNDSGKNYSVLLVERRNRAQNNLALRRQAAKPQNQKSGFNLVNRSRVISPSPGGKGPVLVQPSSNLEPSGRSLDFLSKSWSLLEDTKPQNLNMSSSSVSESLSIPKIDLATADNKVCSGASLQSGRSERSDSMSTSFKLSELKKKVDNKQDDFSYKLKVGEPELLKVLEQMS